MLLYNRKEYLEQFKREVPKTIYTSLMHQLVLMPHSTIYLSEVGGETPKRFSIQQLNRLLIHKPRREEFVQTYFDKKYATNVARDNNGPAAYTPTPESDLFDALSVMVGELLHVWTGDRIVTGAGLKFEKMHGEKFSSSLEAGVKWVNQYKADNAERFNRIATRMLAHEHNPWAVEFFTRELVECGKAVGTVVDFSHALLYEDYLIKARFALNTLRVLQQYSAYGLQLYQDRDLEMGWRNPKFTRPQIYHSHLVNGLHQDNRAKQSALALEAKGKTFNPLDFSEKRMNTLVEPQRYPGNHRRVAVEAVENLFTHYVKLGLTAMIYPRYAKDLSKLK